jgi:hypothetical protein
MRIVAIDPGSTQSAWVQMEGGQPISFGINDNHSVLRDVLGGGLHYDAVVIERIANMGMTVGDEVFDTVHWSGRFHQYALARGVAVHRIKRHVVKMQICHSNRAKDANIRQALIDRFGGKDKGVGNKKRPGPLYGMAKDMWAALAVGVTFFEQYGIDGSGASVFGSEL